MAQILTIPSPSAGKVLKSKVFDVPGSYSWTVPAGVTEVYLTGCGAGGGGCSGVAGSQGGAGGVTSFGALLSLSGGGGAGYGNDYSNGGNGAGAGGSGSGGTGNRGGAGYTGGNANLINGSLQTDLQAARGDGGGGNSNGGGGAGGGAGDYKEKYPASVIPNANISVTIGAGGVGGRDGNLLYPGGTGGDGLLIIEWWG